MDPTPFKDLNTGKLNPTGSLTPIGEYPELSDRTLAVELNLAKFASFLFAPSHTRQDVRARAKTWVANPGTEAKVLARIVVHTVDHETLNTFDHRTCLALQKLWWETPRSGNDGSKQFTVRDLARTMRLSWGRKTFQLLKASLRRLRRVPITWTYAFFDRERGRLLSIEEPLTILEKLRFRQAHGAVRTSAEAMKIIGAGEGGTVDPESATSAFRFNDYIERNLTRRYVKPLYYEIAMGLRGEIALSLYAHLDLVMVGKDTWERLLTGLLTDDLVVRGNYRWAADRRRLVERAVRELQGKPISTGVLKLAIVKSANDQDYKLVVKKTPFKPRHRFLGRDPKAAYLVDEIIAITGDEHSRPYYTKLVAELREPMVRTIMSETRQASLEGRINTSRARFFTDLAERHRGNRPLNLPP